jgi:6-phosphogluconolactonase
MKSRSEIEQGLVLAVVSELRQSIETRGYASLLVSGGSTPIQLFQQLSYRDIAWEKVNIIPVDDRFLPDYHPDQNGTLIREHLLQNKAAKANFIPLILDATNAAKNLELVKKSIPEKESPFTVVILGMGTDGHTASLFPCSAELEEGLDDNNQNQLLITNPTSAPYQRISFTKQALLNTENLYLHCYGDAKKEILDSLEGNSETKYPIKALINQHKIKPEIFWTK